MPKEPYLIDAQIAACLNKTTLTDLADGYKSKVASYIQNEVDNTRIASVSIGRYVVAQSVRIPTLDSLTATDTAPDVHYGLSKSQEAAAEIQATLHSKIMAKDGELTELMNLIPPKDLCNNIRKNIDNGSVKL